MNTETTIIWPDARPIPTLTAEGVDALMACLAEAFGGYSQIPDECVGKALAGRIINNGGGAPSATDLAAWYRDRWGDTWAWEEGDDETFARRVIASANRRLAGTDVASAPVPRQSSPATRAGKLVAAKAGMDVLLGVIQAALGIRDETWNDPLFQSVLRAGIPVLLHSQSQDKAFQEWMEACLEAAMLQGGLKCVDKIREALSTVEVQSAVKAFVSEE